MLLFFPKNDGPSGLKHSPKYVVIAGKQIFICSNVANVPPLNYEPHRLICSLSLLSRTAELERSWRVFSQHARLQTSPKGKPLQP